MTLGKENTVRKSKQRAKEWLKTQQWAQKKQLCNYSADLGSHKIQPLGYIQTAGISELFLTDYPDYPHYYLCFKLCSTCKCRRILFIIVKRAKIQTTAKQRRLYLLKLATALANDTVTLVTLNQAATTCASHIGSMDWIRTLYMPAQRQACWVGGVCTPFNYHISRHINRLICSVWRNGCIECARSCGWYRNFAVEIVDATLQHSGNSRWGS